MTEERICCLVGCNGVMRYLYYHGEYKVYQCDDCKHVHYVLIGEDD